MTRQQQQLAMFVALVGVMIAVYARALRPPSSPAGSAQDPPVAPPSASPGPRAAQAPPEPLAREAQRQHATLLAWGRDPFAQGVMTSQASRLVLLGIVWDAQQPLAIVNGRTVRVGEELDGYRIVEIAQDRVSVTDGTQTFQLLLSP